MSGCITCFSCYAATILLCSNFAKPFTLKLEVLLALLLSVQTTCVGCWCRLIGRFGSVQFGGNQSDQAHRPQTDARSRACVLCVHKDDSNCLSFIEAPLYVLGSRISRVGHSCLVHDLVVFSQTAPIYVPAFTFQLIAGSIMYCKILQSDPRLALCTALHLAESAGYSTGLTCAITSLTDLLWGILPWFQAIYQAS